MKKRMCDIVNQRKEIISKNEFHQRGIFQKKILITSLKSNKQYKQNLANYQTLEISTHYGRVRVMVHLITL